MARASSWVLPCAAILLAAGTPFWQGPVLGALHLRPPTERTQAQLSLSVAQQARRIEDLQQSLGLAEAEATASHAAADAAGLAARAAQDRLSTLALIQLTAVLRHPGPFETELAIVWAASGGQSAVAPLLEQVRAYAAFGVPGRAQLRRDFTVAAARADRGEAGGFLRLSWLGGLFGFTPPRPALARGDEAALGEDTAALLRRAGDQLDADDLVGALTTARAVHAASRDAMSDWIEDAAARVAADALTRRVADLAAGTLRVAGPSSGLAP